ncbi:pyridoxamine 5'-phosphate oxidase family protein [Winogradskya consettensis]|uniref:Pyridoxamine 5'-phosphate oxidase n=1 Tax=Winogradskya consettensis TaxID=113560 RepID=A0A919SXE7_9ACTN|nr:pyridoxamine 5'-phosphate oxidase family protein [Actinoplanes consettensis]GIM80257.1 pyridoxamine 5'-phosphate oxidase [Actinoplanes consettensis]
MANWHEIEKEHPDLAAKVRARFDAGTNKTMATLRRDGAPRISATELKFEQLPDSPAGETAATFGSMGGSLKLLDIRRDPRIAIHSPTLEPPAANPDQWPGDAKLAGVAVEIPAPADNPFPGAGYFRVDITELSLTYLGTPPDHLVIESWNPADGYRRRNRA